MCTWAQIPQLDFLAYASISDLVRAQVLSTTHTLAQGRAPVRLLEVCALTETLGALFMHFMLEVLILGQLLKVDPLSQPALNPNKERLKAFLTQPFSGIR